MFNLLVIIALIGLLPAAIAQSKGRSFMLWWLYGAAIFIVALPHALMLSKASGNGRVKCPHCAELILEEARVCRFCGRDVAGPTAAVAAATTIATPAAVEPAPEIPALADAVQPADPQAKAPVAQGPTGEPLPPVPGGFGSMTTGILIVLLGICALFFAFVFNAPTTAKKPATETPTKAYTPPAAPSYPVAYADDEGATVRARPSKTADALFSLQPGQEFRYKETRGPWYRIALADSSAEQWVHQSAVLSQYEHSQRAGADLRLKSWSWREEYSFAIAEGSVMNVSGRSLENVEAVVTFTTSDGTFITSDDALIEYSPLLPGQTSPWKVTTRWNPQMAKASIEFKTLRGERIGHYEIRRR